jgi:hypothetical protein
MFGHLARIKRSLHDNFLWVLLFDPEDVGDKYLRKAGSLSLGYTAS